MFFSNLYAQFKDVTISFDDRLLRDDEKSALFNLNNSIKKFYVNTVWNDEYRDLELNLNIQIIFEGNANTGNSEAFLIQSLFSNNVDLHFFDKGSQFSLSQNSSLYYDSVYYDPLSSLLGFYGNIILGSELDSWSLYGGNQHYEKARSIAVRSNASNFSRGWEQRLLQINILTFVMEDNPEVTLDKINGQSKAQLIASITTNTTPIVTLIMTAVAMPPPEVIWILSVATFPIVKHVANSAYFALLAFSR